MENKEQFKALFRAWVKRPGAEELLEWLESTDFFEAPASTKFHGAYHGGLLEHSLNVCRELLESDINKSVSTESLVICGLLHDVCKAGVYHPETKRRRDPDTGRWEDYQGYTFSDPFPFGHGEKSVCLIARFIELQKRRRWLSAGTWGRMTTPHGAGAGRCLRLWLSLPLCMSCTQRICGLHRRNSGEKREAEREMKKLFDRLRRWLIKKLGGYTEQLTPIRREIARKTDVQTQEIQVRISFERQETDGEEELKQFCENRLMEMMMQKIKDSGFIKWESGVSIFGDKVSASATIVIANAKSLKRYPRCWVE